MAARVGRSRAAHTTGGRVAAGSWRTSTLQQTRPTGHRPGCIPARPARQQPPRSGQHQVRRPVTLRTEHSPGASNSSVVGQIHSTHAGAHRRASPATWTNVRPGGAIGRWDARPARFGNLRLRTSQVCVPQCACCYWPLDAGSIGVSSTGPGQQHCVRALARTRRQPGQAGCARRSQEEPGGEIEAHWGRVELTAIAGACDSRSLQGTAPPLPRRAWKLCHGCFLQARHAVLADTASAGVTTAIHSSRPHACPTPTQLQLGRPSIPQFPKPREEWKSDPGLVSVIGVPVNPRR